MMLSWLQMKFNYHNKYSQALHYSLHHQNKTQIAYIQEDYQMHQIFGKGMHSHYTRDVCRI